MPTNVIKAKEIAPGKPGNRHGWGKRGTAGAIIAARLTFDNVTHRYGDAAAVSGFSLEIEPGELVCLLGRSGCGKTTLLRIEQPTSGRVLINDQEISGPANFVPPEKRGVGLMFQDYALFPHMSILDNVMFGLHDLPRAEAKSSALAALKRVGLEKHRDDFPHELSGGEQQRVALARAIVPRPSVLLMDEPFSGLDQRLRNVVREETLAILRETRATCIMVTHDPQEAMHLADRIVLMNDGRMEQMGTPQEMYHNPISLFAGRFFCYFNEMPGTVLDGKVETPLGTFAAPGFGEKETVVVCVRPQSIRLTEPGKGVAGRIQRIDFLGEVDQVTISVEGISVPVQVRRPAGYKMPVGSEIGVVVIEEQILVFPV